MRETNGRKHRSATLGAGAKRIGAVVVILAALASQASAVTTYSVDGDISDWGVSLQRDSTYTKTYFIGSSFVPSPVGTIDYDVEDRYPQYGESYDYEALYFDDTEDSLHVGVISSHAWDPADNTILISINGVTKYAGDADEFAWADLGEDERSYSTTYPNYFFEASWSKSAFGEVEVDDPVYVYANCHCSCDYEDRIDLCGDIDTPPHEPPGGNPIPEPMTFALLGVGVAGVVIRRRSRRN